MTACLYLYLSLCVSMQHDSKGEPLAKAAVKKLQKEMAKQKEVHDKFLLACARRTEAEAEADTDEAGTAT